jgi:G patch domain-containing protein 1
MEKWQPCKVLCRRFAIGYHQQEGLDENDELQKLALNPDTMDQLEKERDMLLESGRLQGTQDEVELLVVNQNEMKAEDATTNIEENIDEEEEVIEKPSMDLFKAIFADSDDEQVEEIASKHVEEIVAPPPIKTAEPASTSATATLDTLDINFRPVFTKPTKRTSNMSLNKPRQKKVKSRPIVSLNEEEEMEPQETKMKTSKFRPSAEDFM